MPQARQKPERTRLLAAIHAGAKELGYDDDAYRAMVWGVTGVTSCGRLDERGLRAVAAEVRARQEAAGLGRPYRRRRVKNPSGRPWQPRPPQTELQKKNQPKDIWDPSPRGKSLRKIYKQLEAAGHFAPGGPGWAYAHAMAKKMFGAERLDFVYEEDLYKVITALRHDAARHGADTLSDFNGHAEPYGHRRKGRK